MEARVKTGELDPSVLDWVRTMRRYYGHTALGSPQPENKLVAIEEVRATAPTGPGQPLVDFIRSARNEPPDLFPGLVARGTNIWGGAARSFKTMAAMSAMLSVASGQAFLDREPSRSGAVLYVAEEGGRSKIADRFEKLLGTYTPKHELRVLHRENVTFQGNRWPLVPKALASMHQPALVVLDTYARLNELDENGSAAAHDALECMSGLTTEFGVDVILIHHVGASSTDRLRGHTSLKAGAEGTVLFTREGMTNQVKIVAETKDTEPETLKLQWDRETFLLIEAGGKSPGSISALVHAVSDLGGHLRAVRVSELEEKLQLSRTYIQRLGKQARESGQLQYVEKGPQSGYMLPASEEMVASVVGSSSPQ